MPIVNKFLNLRTAPSVKHLEGGFQALRDIDEGAAAATTAADVKRYLAELDDLDARMRETWFDGSDVRKYHGYTGNTGTVRRRIEERLKAVEAGRPDFDEWGWSPRDAQRSTRISFPPSVSR